MDLMNIRCSHSFDLVEHTPRRTACTGFAEDAAVLAERAYFNRRRLPCLAAHDRQMMIAFLACQVGLAD